MPESTEQEKFWKGSFGDEYTERNTGLKWIASNLAFFSKILKKTDGISSVLELGANKGLNLAAIHQLLPEATLSAVEINEKAAHFLQQALPDTEVFQTSILEFAAEKKWDLVFTKGVLIHINPDSLDLAYNVLYENSKRYILVAEYYNPAPVAIPYRGYTYKLFKRDFAGDLMAMYSDLSLVDYGFIYHRDNNFPQDDLTWFLLKKTN